MSVTYFEKITALVILSLAAQLFVDFGACDDHKSPFRRSSVKEVFVKNDVKSGVSALRQKVRILETHASEQKEKVRVALNSLQRETDLVENLKMEVSEIRDKLNANGENIDDLLYTGAADAGKYFAFSNNTCGGILEGQKGFIKYNPATYTYGSKYFSVYYTSGYRRNQELAILQQQVNPLYCIWTINAMNRPFIKFTVSSLYQPNVRIPEFIPNQEPPATHVVELVKYTENGLDSWKLKTTRLTNSTQHYVFSGPVMYLIYYMDPVKLAYLYNNLHIEFLSFGKRVHRKAHFVNNLLNFTDTEVTHYSYATNNNISATHLNETNQKDYSTIFSTTLLSNVKARSLIFPEMDRCADGDNFIIFDNLIKENGTYETGVDCCKSNCSKDDPFLITMSPGLLLVSTKTKTPLKYNISSKSEKPPAHLNYNAQYTSSTPICGGVVGGVSGKITLESASHQRCVWSILPSEIPETNLAVRLDSYYRSHKLYLMQMFDGSGNILAEGPNITIMPRHRPSRSLTQFSFDFDNNQPMYLVYYSDVKTALTPSFSLTWKLKLKPSITTNQSNATNSTAPFAPEKHLRHFFTVKDVEGKLPSSEYTLSRHSYVLVPDYNYFSRYIPLQLHLELEAEMDENGCTKLWKQFRIFQSKSGIFHNISLNCDNTNGTSATLNAKEGMVLILTEGKAPSIKFRWTQGGNISHFLSNDDECGGVVRAERGIIRYKSLSRYNNREQCIWLVVSPNNQALSFNLVSNGFDTCCDYISFFTFSNSGELQLAGILKQTSNSTAATFHTNFVAAVFHSDGITRGTGFVMHFEEHPNASSTANTSYSYYLSDKSAKFLHNSDREGVAILPILDSEDGDTEQEDGDDNYDVIVFAYSRSSTAPSFELYQQELRTRIQRKGNEIKDKEIDCFAQNTSNIELYHFDNFPRISALNESQILDNCLPHSTNATVGTDTEHNDDNNDYDYHDKLSPADRQKWTVFAHLAFIVVYKAKQAADEDERNGKQVEIEWLNNADCGDVFSGQHGDIFYKPNHVYRNYERCLWLVEAPQASQIEFELVTSGLETCCDTIMINSIDPYSGVVGNGSFIELGENQTSTVIVSGPVAVVTFYSDSSVAGKGFHLEYRTTSRYTEQLPFSFRLAAGVKSNYTFDMQDNEMAVVAYSCPSCDYHRKYSTAISVFRPQVNETCISDKLTFYEFSFPRNSTTKMIKSVNATNILANATVPDENGRCSPITTAQLPTNCTKVGECVSVSGAGLTSEVVRLNSGTFIAVYTAVNTSSSTLAARGFMVSLGKS